MNFYTSVLLIISIHTALTTNQNPGHLKPFGSVGSLVNVTELDQEFPNVLELFSYYIPQSELILSRQVLIHDKHFSIWKTDEQLEDTVYGLSDTNIQVELFAPRSRQKVHMTFGEFFDRYTKQSLLFAKSVPEILQKYLTVPKPLQCDLVLECIQSAILLINHINASPIMFGEDHDRFHCVLRGTKRIVLVNTLKYPDVRKTILPDKRQRRVPSINPDRVDFDEFPAFANVDYYIANLKGGDCLFMPNDWIFQERTFESTISVIYNIKHQQARSIDINQLHSCPEYDPKFTLDQIDWPEEPKSFRDVIVGLASSKIHGFDNWLEKFSKHLSYDLASDPETLSLFEEFYGAMDVDGDDQITIDEIEQVKGVHQHHLTNILYEITKAVSKNRKVHKTNEPQNNQQKRTRGSDTKADL